MTRIVDVRLVLDRHGRVRVIVEGRRLFEAASASAALGFVTSQLAKVEPHRQLGALASALVGATDPVETGSAAGAPIANETGSVDKARVFGAGHPKKPTDLPIAKTLVSDIGSVAPEADVRFYANDRTEPDLYLGGNETGHAGKAVE